MSSFVHMKRSKLFSHSCINFYFFADETNKTKRKLFFFFSTLVMLTQYTVCEFQIWNELIEWMNTQYWHINKWRTILWTLKFAQQSENAHNNENLICGAWNSTYQTDSIIFRSSLNVQCSVLYFLYPMNHAQQCSFRRWIYFFILLLFTHSTFVVHRQMS